MKPLPNSPRSSMQRLRGVLQQALLDGFQSRLKDKSKIALSEEIVNAILFEIEKWLVEFSSETIDQVAGRLENKIAEIEENLGNLDEDEPLSVQDETIESIRNELEGGNEADKSFTDTVCKVLGGINKDSKLKKFKKYLEKTAKPYKKQKQKE